MHAYCSCSLKCVEGVEKKTLTIGLAAVAHGDDRRRGCDRYQPNINSNLLIRMHASTDTKSSLSFPVHPGWVWVGQTYY